MWLDGWIRRLFAYGFGKVFDQCENCEARLFDKPTRSAVVAMLLTFAVLAMSFSAVLAALLWLG